MLHDELAAVAEQIAEAFGALPVRVRLRVGHGQSTTLVASAGVPNAQAEAETPARGPTGRILTEGISLRLDDLHRPQASSDNRDPSASWRSLVGAPIVAAGDIFGLVTVGSTEPHRFDGVYRS